MIGIAEALPKTGMTAGGDAHQHLGFSVGRKRFAWYLDDHHGDGIISLTCKMPPGRNTELIDSDADRFFMPSYLGPRGWGGVRLDTPDLNWGEIEDLLELAYRVTAPRSLITKLDETRGSDRS